VGAGAPGYGKRFAHILGQYSIQLTVTYGLGSALHEDNRYFNSERTHSARIKNWDRPPLNRSHLVLLFSSCL
jgi:hypothetical protein